MEKSINDNYKNIKEKSDDFINIISNIFSIILDKTVNGLDAEHKYYRYFISIVIILILGLFYYLNEKQNLFFIKDTKYELLGTLFMLGFSIYCFLFFVYRNNRKWDSETGTRYKGTYTEVTRKLTEDNKLNTTNLKATVTSPLINIIKYVATLFLIIVIPLIVINYILYLHKNNSEGFNITQNIIGLSIFIVIFAIIAKLFSIKSDNVDGCSLEPDPKTDSKTDPNTAKAQPTFTELLKEYSTYILCILKNIVFFIPCLLVILADEINKDIKLTPSSIYILFFILLTLVTLIFLLPLIFKYLRTINKSDILSGEGPFYLNEKKTLGKYQNLDKNINSTINLPTLDDKSNESKVENKVDTLLNALKMDNDFNIFNIKKDLSKDLSNDSIIPDDLKDLTKDIKTGLTKGFNFKLLKNEFQYNIETEYNNPAKGKNRFPYNYTYSISFYIYINPQPTNTSIAYTKDTELFNYGYKPVIYYNGKSRKIIIKSRTINNKSDQLDTIYEMKDVKHQKWLYFVINYENNIIDVFIDGKLVGSKDNVTPYFKGDNVTIGEKDGIYGSIKEIYYYDKIKTPDSIEFLYNLTKNKN